ncbi:diaminopimelate decarboxylase [Keratinibaculum paraultunense]|uniref:Diaminopimelate decarboxylase n=1 Tax=Keratinibaculum paraultunense TaxID=1278232 RepID=A0A4V2UU14_9FIRM|nr:diaminopimelate decarboxylase [Keratinibaculum paraultunense]QQY79822.1 diaminopimelate decarboxylase [Keratinibaculum paraultunense]TCS88703.1 diaminopimelate decarboxylase [Keratinibaculum paraultunense]
MKLFGTMKINELGHLEIGKCDSTDLVKKYGTPLYVMDETLIRDNCKLFKTNFTSKNIQTEIIYASKAFLTLAMCTLINEEGLSLDVVSGGELYTAIKANFPTHKIYMHGNNKTKEELTMAIKTGIGRIIVDNKCELDLIENICKAYNKKISILLRVNPGIETNTHEYIKTTKNSSKFGISIFDKDIFNIVNKLNSNKYIDFKGFHSHIGSQILNEESFYEEINVMMNFIKEVSEKCGTTIQELNLGGGFGVYYSKKDRPINLKNLLKNMLDKIKSKADEFKLPYPKIMIEPGRSIVANAGTTLYQVGCTKKTHSGKHYVFVDGGMNDNPRTALYNAQYEAAIANRMNDEKEGIYTITGRCCESGDIIAKDISLPHPNIGDIIAVSTTGAYNYSMASNYNRLPRPSVIFVKNGNSKCIVRRETYEDIIKNDLPL